MAKILYIYNRENPINPTITQKVKLICEELTPDNIKSKPEIYSFENVIYGLISPNSTITRNNKNVLLGNLYGQDVDWEKSGTNPDGNFAIFRYNNNKIEVVTDCLGTRAIWYYMDENVFIASTSQVAIIKYLNNFEFDEQIIPWMLSNGSLGPTSSWDKRLKKIPSDACFVLNTNEWTLTKKVIPVSFEPLKESKEVIKSTLENCLIATFKTMEINLKKWAVTLSGGHDSRAILLLLKKYSTLKYSSINTITWGIEKSLEDDASDINIAQLVARAIDTNHQTVFTEKNDENIENVINRFLINGEGRIDHITGYLDGFLIWKNIYEQGIEGIIRGDEVFGYNKIYSPLIIRSFMGLNLCQDFNNLKKYQYINEMNQNTPEFLQKANNESLSTWKDRIFQLYRIPYIQSALADLKYPYIEQINPFLSRRIVYFTRKMPDKFREDKKLFKEIMKEYDIDIPYSKRGSNASLKEVLRELTWVKLIKSELTSPYAQNIFPKEFLESVLSNLTIKKNGSNNKTLIQQLKQMIPNKYKRLFFQKNVKLNLDENLLAFRMLIVIRMHKELNRK